MRLRLTIRSPKPCAIGFNYSYYLSAAIYRWIEQSSSEYSEYLHQRGFPTEGTLRKFKHFCFSNLIIPKRRTDNNRIIILSDTVTWYISMPVEESLQHLIMGMFEKQEFFIEREEQRFTIQQVETLPDPEWKRQMKFRMLSPVTISVSEEINGKRLPQYLRANDPRLAEALQKNILNKYRSLYGGEPADKEFNCTLDEQFIRERGGHDAISKLITIKQGREGETKVRGFMCPVLIEGNAELIKLAYESGIGEKGSMGFGMLEIIEN